VRHIRVSEDRFDLDTIIRMQRAFDLVCHRLKLAPEDKRRRSLANFIIVSASAGDTDDLAANAADRLRT
jgi:hypothetical protein